MAQRPKFCGHCGQRLDAEDRFCGGCGQPVADGAPDRPAAEPPSGEPTAPRPPVDEGAVPPPPIPRPTDKKTAKAESKPPKLDRQRPRKRRWRVRYILVPIVLAIVAFLVASGPDLAQSVAGWLGNLKGGSALAVSAVAFNPDGRIVGAGTEKGFVAFWGTGDGSRLARYRPALSPVRSLAFSYDNALVACGYNGRILLCDQPSGGVLTEFDGHAGATSCLSFQWGDGMLVGWGDASDDAIRWWDVETGRQDEPLRFRSTSLSTAALSWEHQYMARGCPDGTIEVWDLLLREQIGTLRGLHPGAVQAVAIDSLGLRVASSHADTSSHPSTVIVWDVLSGGDEHWISGPHDVASLAFSADGDRIVGGGKGFVRIWDAFTGQEQRTINVR